MKGLVIRVESDVSPEIIEALRGRGAEVIVGTDYEAYWEELRKKVISLEVRQAAMIPSSWQTKFRSNEEWQRQGKRKGKKAR